MKLLLYLFSFGEMYAKMTVWDKFLSQLTKFLAVLVLVFGFKLFEDADPSLAWRTSYHLLLFTAIGLGAILLIQLFAGMMEGFIDIKAKAMDLFMDYEPIYENERHKQEAKIEKTILIFDKKAKNGTLTAQELSTFSQERLEVLKIKSENELKKAELALKAKEIELKKEELALKAKEIETEYSFKEQVFLAEQSFKMQELLVEQKSQELEVVEKIELKKYQEDKLTKLAPHNVEKISEEEVLVDGKRIPINTIKMNLSKYSKKIMESGGQATPLNLANFIQHKILHDFISQDKIVSYQDYLSSYNFKFLFEIEEKK